MHRIKQFYILAMFAILILFIPSRIFALTPSTQIVNISGFAFSPSTITITAGDSLTWKNLDTAEHTVTSDQNIWDSGFLTQNQSYTRQFTTPGIYTYHCAVHTSMTGTIIVQSATSPQPSPTVVLQNGDANNDGTVDTTDLITVLQNWLLNMTTLVDQYGDGRINSLDFTRVFQQLSAVVPTATPTPISSISNSLINVPYFSGAVPFNQTAIFWFGKVTPTENYADVRIGYNDSELYVNIGVIDKRLWYDTNPTPQTFSNWDSVSLALDTNSNPTLQPGSSSYRFDAEGNPSGITQTTYQQAYKGNGSVWTASSIPFTAIPGWRGDAWNNDVDDRGWVMTYHIPFSSLGFSGKPTDFTKWHLQISLYDRDDSQGTAIPVKVWPDNSSQANPSSWGIISYGLPTFVVPPIFNSQTVTIQQGLNNQTVPDAGVGGYTNCGGSNDYWTQWGNVTDGTGGDFNIQNESDISDWPCFSKYYVTFPLSLIPPGKVIVSAKLQLHLFGNAGTAGQATPSYIQVARIASDFSDMTVTWNNGPGVMENYSYAWVNPMQSALVWPGELREWDISRAVKDAYQQKTPLRLVLYSVDSDYNSGKYFVSSDTGDWNAAGRPTIQVTYGD